MRIAIDGRALTGRFTGDRTYWRNLLNALLVLDRDNTYLVYSRTPVAPDELRAAPNLTFRALPARNDRLWTLLTLTRALREDRADLVHVQYTTPPRCPCPVVTTVHDISFRLYPEWFPTKHRMLLNVTVPASMRRAARVITDSESSRRDILRVYDLPPEKLAVTRLGLPEGFGVQGSVAAARDWAREKFGLDRPFVLAVGVLQPRKNLGMLAEAFGRMRAVSGLDCQLALVGKAGWDTEQAALQAAARQAGGDAAAQAIVFTGYVDDAELPLLYRACAAFAYPSLYEGFGLPPLEAMACEAPVLVSDAPAMPEVAGDAALILPARDPQAWADALTKILTDRELAARLSAGGPAHAAQFTWTATAQATLEVYREAARQ